MNKQMKQNLEAVVDALVEQDTAAAKEAFHSYLRLKSQSILMGEAAEESDDEDDKSDESDDKDDAKDKKDKKKDKKDDESDDKKMDKKDKKTNPFAKKDDKE